MKNLYQKIIRFFTTQRIPSRTISLKPSFFILDELIKHKEKESEERIKQFIRLEVKKQLNKKK